MRVDPGFMCSYSLAEIGWRDSYNSNGAMDPVDQWSNSYMWIQPVAEGDLLRIVTLGKQLVNVISVTSDMLVGTGNDAIFWDGSMYSDQLAALYQVYPVSKNGSSMGSFFLNFSSGGSSTVSAHSFSLDTLRYLNGSVTLNIRHTIYDSLGNIYARPRFDVMTNNNTTIELDIYGYPDGVYTSEVFGWRSDGYNTNVSTLAFMNYICGDLNNDGSVDNVDLTYLVDLLFGSPPPPPPHPASADLNCDGGSADIVDLSAFVDYLFGSGQLNCCHSLP